MMAEIGEHWVDLIFYWPDGRETYQRFYNDQTLAITTGESEVVYV